MILSHRLWLLLAKPDTSNPIFRRVSQAHKPAAAARRIAIPRPVQAAALLALLALVIYAPPLLLLLLEIPVLMLSLVVLTPLLLPFCIPLAGAYVAAQVIAGIYREKHQHTYELLCASFKGSLNANWFFAIGILHRGGWFPALHWGVRLSLRIGQSILFALTLLALWLLLSNPPAVGFAQLHLLLFLLLMLGLYYTNMTQTFVLSLLVGLYASSFDVFKRDAALLGMLLYALAQTLPFLLAALVYFAFDHLAAEAHPLMRLGIESSAAAAIVLTREAAIALLWHPLKHRLNSGAAGGTDDLHSRAAPTSALSAT